MSDENTSIIESQQSKPSSLGRSSFAIGHGVMISSFDELWRFAQIIYKSGFAPSSMKSVEAIAIAVQLGAEIGLPPMAALQNIAVINGRPSVWGDAQLGVVRATRQLEHFEEWFEVDGKRIPRFPATDDKLTDSLTAVCRVKRSGYEAVEQSFSVGQAKKANLWKKSGAWTEYPARMLQMRARSYALRDQFGDALRGMLSVEELRDTPPPMREADGAVIFTEEKPKGAEQPPALPEGEVKDKPAPAPTAPSEKPKRRSQAQDAKPAPAAQEPAPAAQAPGTVEDQVAKEARDFFGASPKPDTPLNRLRALLINNNISDEKGLEVIRKFRLADVKTLDEVPIPAINMILQSVPEFLAEAQI